MLEGRRRFPFGFAFLIILTLGLFTMVFILAYPARSILHRVPVPTHTLIPIKTLQPSPSPAPVKVSFEALADQGWQDTGVKVQPGDTLAVQYVSGLWSPWAGGKYDGIGSGGDPKCTCNVILGVSHAALIGKIGDGNPFLVGNTFTQKAGQAGDLYLGINDTRLDDNSGSLKVTITLTH
jgi:hypothetical protein